MNYLREYDAVIDVRECLVSLSTNLPPEPLTDQRRLSLRVADDGVSVPPGSCVFVPIACNEHCTADRVAELHPSLFRDHGFLFAWVLVHFTGGHGNLVLTNFANERQLITKRTAAALFERIDDAERCFLLQTGSDTAGRMTLAIDVNTNLSP